MMEILPLHIEYLLTRHDCVIVPALGAFIASEKEAYIDLEHGIILPRLREISFNSSVVTDDGLLAHSIARREGLSYEDARRLLAGLIERLRADLDEEGEVTLGMTGRLLKDSEGFISFQPRLSTVQADIRQGLKLVEAAPVAPAPVAVETMDSMVEQNDDQEDGMRTIKVRADRYVFTISKRAVHAAAMLVTILTVGLSLLLPINHDNEQKASVISFDDFFRHAVKTESHKTDDSATVSVEENDSITAHEDLLAR